MSESAAFGAPDYESLIRFMPQERIDDSSLWEFHTKDNPYRPPEADKTLYQSLEVMASTLFGPFHSSEDRLRKLAYTHYEWIRLTIEAARRKQPFCRGLLFWMLNDCWPASGWSLIDYYLRPKAGYYGMKYAARALHSSFREKDARLEIWVSNATPQTVSREIHIGFQQWSGEKHVWPLILTDIPAHRSICIASINPEDISHPHAGVFYADMPDGRSWYFHGMPFEMQPPPVQLSFTGRQTGPHEWTCSVSASQYARVVTFQGPVAAEDNYFDLFAGETRTLRLTLEEHADKESVYVCAWNAPRTHMT
jgi:beta-mannosidase